MYLKGDYFTFVFFKLPSPHIQFDFDVDTHFVATPLEIKVVDPP